MNKNKLKDIPLMQLTNLPTLESFCLPELTLELRSPPCNRSTPHLYKSSLFKLLFPKACF